MLTSTRQCLLKLLPEDLDAELSETELLRLKEKVEAALHVTKLRMHARSIRLLDLEDDLLLKIIDCMTTSEGRGLLLCCTRLSGLARPNVFRKRQKEVYVIFFPDLMGALLHRYEPAPLLAAGCGARCVRFR